MKLHQELSRADGKEYRSASNPALNVVQPKAVYCTSRKNVEIPFDSIHAGKAELDLMGRNLVEAAKRERQRVYKYPTTKP